MNEPHVYTVGYSNHEPDYFLSLLTRHAITAVADVRSSPYSRRIWYCSEQLKQILATAGLRYVYIGKQLGARRDEPECYVDKQARYDRVAQLPAFVEGIDRVLTGAGRFRIALMCGERDPLDCHRGVLISPALVTRGCHIDHILTDGLLETHSQLEQRMIRLVGIDPLFDQITSHSELLARAYTERGKELAFNMKAQPMTPDGRRTD